MAINDEHDSIRVGVETLEILLTVLCGTTEYKAYFRAKVGTTEEDLNRSEGVTNGHNIVEDYWNARCDFETEVEAYLRRIQFADLAGNSKAYNNQSECLIAFLASAKQIGENHLTWESYYKND